MSRRLGGSTGRGRRSRGRRRLAQPSRDRGPRRAGDWHSERTRARSRMPRLKGNRRARECLPDRHGSERENAQMDVRGRGVKGCCRTCDSSSPPFATPPCQVLWDPDAYVCYFYLLFNLNRLALGLKKSKKNYLFSTEGSPSIGNRQRHQRAGRPFPAN